MNKLFEEISNLLTEQKNSSSNAIDELDTLEILRLINNEDKIVPIAISEEIENIKLAVDLVVDAFKHNGRLLYFGAGTSGRLGILDAVECPPTFGTPEEMIQGRIAGGNDALFKAVEGAEDNPQNGIDDLLELSPNINDVVCGIAASGRTPYVRGVLEEAQKINCKSILITTSGHENAKKLGLEADVIISPRTGAEIIAGSTRMKSGTAQKLVLNMITTTAMIKLGKTYGNIMVDLQQTNQKLKERSKKIIMDICGKDYDESEKLLFESRGEVKSAIVMGLLNVNYSEAKEILERSDGFVKKALNKNKKSSPN